ncbi:hypothetical protein I316_03624 [Kwoniella heveanensis BCC8398]|uniref:Uncharacterized protein n=1 Tax=Kwoniella heveanensis BCC8398 TaxID=1296120 RepID=A0A1B9GU65_9TREE|nr:hypothetical protein I316_03624 [Kwoniella heveanensis BCC8398]
MVSIGSVLSGGPIFLKLATGDQVPVDPAAQAEMLEAGLKALMEPHLGLFLGPVMIGLIADLVLFGVMIKQLTMWWEYAREDRWFIKSIVGAAGSESLRPSLLPVYKYVLCYILYQDPSPLFTLRVPEVARTSMGSSKKPYVVTLQVFYTDRAYKLSGKNKPLALLICSAILISVVGGIGSKVSTVNNGDPSAARNATIFIYLYTAGAMGADFIITSSIMISAETQLPPTLMAIVFLIVFAYKTTKAAAHPDQVIIDVTSNLTGFFIRDPVELTERDHTSNRRRMVMPKTYIVGFLAVLNARTALRAVFSSSNEPSQRKQNTYALTNRNGQSGVQVTTEIYTQADNVDENNNHQRSTVYRTGEVPYDEESMGRVEPSEAGSKVGLTWSDDVKVYQA